MSAQWCTPVDLYDQLPPLRNDGELGINPALDVIRYIENATARVKHQIQGRYSLAQFGATPDSVPRSVRLFTAVQAAILACKALQAGALGEKQLTTLNEELIFWRRLAVNGSLLGDDDKPITSLQGVVSGSGETGLSLVEDLYVDGARYDVPDSNLAGPRSDWGGNPS